MWKVNGILSLGRENLNYPAELCDFLLFYNKQVLCKQKRTKNPEA